MKIDATRYRLFLTNPEEYRLRECWNLVPTSSGEGTSLRTQGRRRGSAFHELTEGAAPEDLTHLGERAVEIASEMDEANRKYSPDMKVIWREKEFDIGIPDSPHRMCGRIDSRVERWDEQFILDYKTTRYRTKEEMARYRDELFQNPQVDFYLCAEPDLRKFVYRILWQKPKTVNKVTTKVVMIDELEITRAKWQLEAFQRGVHQVCEIIEFCKREFGIEKSWPRAVRLPVSPDIYQYAEIYQRSIYPGMEDSLENFTARTEHLACLREGSK